MNIVAKFLWAYLFILFISLLIIFRAFQFHPQSFIYHYAYSKTDLNGGLNYTVKDFRKRKINRIDDWIYVSENVFVYSAFWENRLYHPFIRIIGGFCGEKLSLNLCCFILSHENSTLMAEKVTAYYTIIGENHQKECKASYFTCRPQSRLTTKSLVSLVHVTSDMTSEFNDTWMRIRNVFAASNNSTRIGLCVRPFFGWNNTFRIAEFVAYYKVLGVDHFTFYDFDTGGRVLQLLEHLKINNYSLEILPWSLPEEAQKMWEYGQMASIQDCLYRYMYQMSHVLLVDVDEFATPLRDKTIKELIHHIDDQKQKWNIMYMRSRVFCLEVEEPLFPMIPSFLTQSHIHRENYIYPLSIRSKCIIKPQYVITGGIHYPLQMLRLEKRACVNGSTVLLHHYRGHICKKEHGLELDLTARKYFMDLITSVAVREWIKLFHPNTKGNIIEHVIEVSK